MSHIWWSESGEELSLDCRMHLEIGGDGAPADVYELRHVIVSVKGPDAALEVEVLVELDALGLPDIGVELVGAVVTRPQRDAVKGYIVQESCLCGRMSSKFGLAYIVSNYINNISSWCLITR